MITHPTIYKRTSSGKVQVWYAEVDGERYRTTSGQIDGEKTTTNWTVAKPKNVGRANETTPEEQAELEVAAEYEKKLARDYHKSMDTIDEAMRFKPMLATKWQDRKATLRGAGVLFMQPKLDGMRCIAKADGLWSREGKPILGAPHIYEMLKPYFDANPDAIFDGELYNHDLKDDFNKIVSAAKKKKPTAADLEVSRQNLQYWIYDMPSVNDLFMARLHALETTIAWNSHLILTPTEVVDFDEIDERSAAWIEEGYEGAMIRLHQKYENKRSNSLIKWKEMQDEEFTILDIQEGDGNRAGIAARVILRLSDDRTFSAGLIGNVPYCKLMLEQKDRHIGKKGTVVFQNYTPDGVPRFPKFKTVRDYE